MVLNYLIFGQFLTYLQNRFLLSNLEFECLYAQIENTRIFIKFLFQDKKWQQLQYCNFHQYQQMPWEKLTAKIPKINSVFETHGVSKDSSQNCGVVFCNIVGNVNL